MRKVEIEVYKFDELESKVKQKVIDRFRESNDLPFLTDDLTEFINSELIEKGIEKYRDMKVYYNLNYSQGDGLCFVGVFDWDFEGRKWTFRVEHRHEISVSFDGWLEEGCTVEEEKKAYVEFKNVYEEICRKARDYGYDIIKGENEDKTIIENIESNEYEFLANGDIFVS